jgi:hypothetical protein
MESLVAKEKTLAGRTPFVLYCKPNTIEVVGFFSGMLHFFQVDDFTEKDLLFRL